MRRRAGTAEARRKERTGSAPSRTREAGGAMPTVSKAAGRSMPCSEKDPLMQRPRLARIGGEILDELRDARIVPGAPEVGPNLVQRLAAEVPPPARQRVDELHEPVGEHDQKRRRMPQAIAQLLEQPGFVIM